MTFDDATPEAAPEGPYGGIATSIKQIISTSYAHYLHSLSFPEVTIDKLSAKFSNDIILLKVVLVRLDYTSESHGYLATLGHTGIASYDNCII